MAHRQIHRSRWNYPLTQEYGFNCVPADSLHGGTIQVGIDFNEIPRFAKIFDINDLQLFLNEIPKHLVHVDDFYMDKRLVTNERFNDHMSETRPAVNAIMRRPTPLIA